MKGFEGEIVEQCSLGVLVWELEDPGDDLSLRLCFANPCACRELRLDPAAVIGKRVHEIFPDAPLDRVNVYAQVCRDRIAKELGSIQGREGSLGVKAYPVLERSVAVVFESQIELEDAARREHQLRQFLDQVIENIPAMVFIKDAVELRFERFNRAGEDMIGVPRSALIGKCDYDFFPREQAEFFIQKDREVLARGGIEDIPAEPIETPQGRRWLHTRKIPLLDEHGRPAHLLGLSIDITEQHRVDELRRDFYAKLELENTRVLQATRVKSEFLASMSHELRTPLNAIIGFAEVLSDDTHDPLPPQKREFVDDILNAGRHLLRLISDVLDLAKVESGRMEIAPARVDLAAIVEEVRHTLRLTAQERRIRIETEITIREAVIDPDRVKQILYNYLSNALKFTSPGGLVTIRLLAEGETHFRLEVEDTGIGIAEADFSRLFIDFQQLDSGTAKLYGGTGLGLALTKRLAEAMGGSVCVRSERGVGSVFQAILPLNLPI